jgi:hypothetical protein
VDFSNRKHNEVLSFKHGLGKAILEEVGSAKLACREGIAKEPKNFWLWKRFVKLHAATDIEAAILVCKEAIKRHGHLAPSMMAVNLYAAKGDYLTAMNTMMKISDNKTFAKKLKEALTPSEDTGLIIGFPSKEERASLEG